MAILIPLPTGLLQTEDNLNLPVCFCLIPHPLFNNLGTAAFCMKQGEAENVGGNKQEGYKTKDCGALELLKLSAS